MFNSASTVSAGLIPIIQSSMQAQIADKHKTKDERAVETLVSAEIDSMLRPHRDYYNAQLKSNDSTPLEKAIAAAKLKEYSGLSTEQLAALEGN